MTKTPQVRAAHRVDACHSLAIVEVRGFPTGDGKAIIQAYQRPSAIPN